MRKHGEDAPIGSSLTSHGLELGTEFLDYGINSMTGIDYLHRYREVPCIDVKHFFGQALSLRTPNRNPRLA